EFLERPNSLLQQALQTTDQWHSAPLWQCTYDAVFYAGVETVFGDGIWNPSLREQFARFDSAFALLVAGIPISLLRVRSLRTALATVSGKPRSRVSGLLAERSRLYEKHGFKGRDID